jgi:hypothetical protein
MWITPNFQDNNFNWPLSLDDKIEIFLDRTKGWQLGIADTIINGESDDQGNIISDGIPHSGFATLHVVLSYFEMIAKYQDGFANVGRSRHYFREGVLSVFPHLQNQPQNIVRDLLDTLYEGARCGLYHGGMTDPRIVLTGDTNSAMVYEAQNQRLVINPHRLVPALTAHLEAYGNQLRDSTNIQLRNDFERRFDFDTR